MQTGIMLCVYWSILFLHTFHNVPTNYKTQILNQIPKRIKQKVAL